MRYTVGDKCVEIFLEKQFDYEPEYREIFDFPESTERILDVGIWEERECKIVTNFYEDFSTKMCKHFVKIADIVVHYQHGAVEEKVCGYYPRLLIAYNEGRCATTGVCVDCLLEHFKEK